MALFTTPLAERRENFVQARFAEDSIFRDSDIEAWLEKERQAKHPDPFFLNRFTEAFKQAILPREHAELITKYGIPTELSTLMRANLGGYIDFSLLRLLHLLQETANIHFYDSWHAIPTGTTIVLEPTAKYDSYGQIALTCDKKKLIPTPLAAVLSILLNCWEFGSEEKKKQVRDFICKIYADEIRRQRKSAEKDFDNACAISEDGRKIMHADWVVVAYPKSEPWEQRSFKLFPAEAFKGNKVILLREERQRLRSGALRFDKQDPNSVISWLQNNTRKWLQYPGWNTQIDYRITCNNTRILITDCSLCPEELPEGGIEFSK